MRRNAFSLPRIAVLACSLPMFSLAANNSQYMRGAFRKAPQNGWVYVHLEGPPFEIGFQHGYLLAPEVDDAVKVEILEATHGGRHDWGFYRSAAQNILWPHIEQEYREELRGISEGLKAAGEKLDLWDVVALNAICEWPYYIKEYDRQHGLSKASAQSVPDRCSAFVATGSYTKDGKVIIAHNNWTSYLDGERWTIIFDIVPASGSRILMDGVPGLIHSADDFGVNSAGIMITETTISHFSGYDPEGIPEFVRARKAMQYAASIDDFARIMKEGNNGGYANTWLVADSRRNEIASLELGLKNVTVLRKSDGFFVGSNFPANPKLIKEETDFNVHDMANSANARHARWEQLMAQYKGKVDVATAESFLADHYDTYEKKEDVDERTLCGHIDLSARGDPGWQPPYGAAGAVQNKVADASMAAAMSFVAARGHACGISFKAADYLAKHPGFAWEKPLLRDMDAYSWTKFAIAPDHGQAVVDP
jgi:hypothetical protein